MIEWLKKAVRWIGCMTGLYHLRTKWDDEGITCIDCGYFESKYEYLAALYGGGW